MNLRPNIYFFSENISFKLENKTIVKKWFVNAAKSEGFKINNLNYIFCDDEYLRSKNIEFLNHKTFTDIITFQYDDEPGFVSGDIFISIERVKFNAKKFKKDFNNELHRVMIHGLMHLCGYKDKTALQKKQMRALETKYLKLIEC